jgi:acyl transferase domain-containing protein
MSSKQRKVEPIAIVGLGCRFPGDATSGEKLWDFLAAKKSARSEVPRDRYNVDAFYHPDADRYGTVSSGMRASPKSTGLPELTCFSLLD